MRTTVEQENPTRLKLAVEVDPAELDPYYKATLRRLSGEVKIPGFRKGKVPAQVLETRIGRERIRNEMLSDSLPKLFREAAASEQVKPIATPDIAVTAFEEGQPLAFTATVEIVPQFQLPPYKGLEVEQPSTAATEEEISEQMEQLRQRFGTLEVVSRNAAKGDHVLIDLTCYRHSEKIEAASSADLLYEVGTESFVPELDKELEGKRTGDILKFNATLPDSYPEPHGGQEVSFSVIVKEVHAKKLPALDDEFARTASEFDTLEELRSELVRRIEFFKNVQAATDVRNKILEEVLDLADIPLPESMVAAAIQRRLADFLRDIRNHGVDPKEYLEASSITEEQLVERYRPFAERDVAADLLLTAVGEAEGLAATQEEIEEQVERSARRLGKPASELLAELESSGRVPSLAGDILRRKALDYLVEHAKVSGEGQSEAAAQSKEQS